MSSFFTFIWTKTGLPLICISVPRSSYRGSSCCDIGLHVATRAVCPMLPAVLLQALRLIRAVEELALEELHGDDGEDEHEEDVDDENVEHILEGVHHTVEHSLRQHTPETNAHKYTHMPS